MAAVLLATILGTASARNFSISNQNFRVTWSRLELDSELESFTIRCQVTLEGSFAGRTFPKVRGTLIGAITRAAFKTESCTGGQVSARAVPWHLTYEAFQGLLPNAIAIRLLIARYLISVRFLERTCTYGTATDNLGFSASVNASRELTELRPMQGRDTSHLLEGPFGCRLDRRIAGAGGDGVIRLLNASTTRITLTLI
jgi:hypothetical protein